LIGFKTFGRTWKNKGRKAVRTRVKALAFRIPAFRRWWLRVGPIVRHRLTGSPVPPHPEVKHYWIQHFQASHGIKILIETGTNQGHTVEVMLKKFDRIYTIELDEVLWRRASEKFAPALHVQVIHGDSGLMLPTLLTNVKDQCLFWLDGHYCGPGTGRSDDDTPIVKELLAIATQGRNDHVILIDDARLFNGKDGYPMVHQIADLSKRINPNYSIRVVDDMIQIFEK
jgi:hypothetical protein